MFSENELRRYSRQILLPGFGPEGQQRLKAGNVLVIGAGGLGSPALNYLAAAGVGRIGILDFDIVDESNLQRQILFTTKDIGLPKAATAAARLAQLNPLVKTNIHHCILNSTNAMDILGDYDVIIDGSDNLPTRYLVNDACVLLKKTLIYGAVFQFEGQASVFNQVHGDGNRGPNYRDLFPEPPPAEMVPSCNVGGVLGVLPGIIGTIQATEAIKVLTGVGKTLSGRLMIFDGLDCITRYLTLKPNPENPISGNRPTIHALIDYEAFCNVGALVEQTANEISPGEVKKLLDAGRRIQIVDVRETFEYALSNIGGLNIPLQSLEEKAAKIDREGQVVVVCKSGQRSLRAIRLLQSQFGLNNLINLKGGLLKWKEEVDSNLKL